MPDCLNKTQPSTHLAMFKSTGTYSCIFCSNKLSRVVLNERMDTKIASNFIKVTNLSALIVLYYIPLSKLMMLSIETSKIYLLCLTASLLLFWSHQLSGGRNFCIIICVK